MYKSKEQATEHRRQYRSSLKNSKAHVAHNLKSRAKKWAEHPWMKHHNSAKYCRRGIRKSLRYELTTDQVKFIWFRDKAMNMTRPSIDRKNQLDHYTFKNVRFLELAENISRSNKSRERDSRGRLLPGRNYITK
ncbi:MAG: hypothetical protein UX36_C0006G0016 [Microgenomates group bacterium GW2011_GWC1_46_15]|nr:MAG: hypothetical protein UX36_C0006G0016 [Microgenomates group bacterium GW2011_GWC1_46_15]